MATSSGGATGDPRTRVGLLRSAEACPWWPDHEHRSLRRTAAPEVAAMVMETAGGSGEESRLRRGGEAHPRTAAARAAAAPGRLAARRLRARGCLPWPASGDCERLDRSGGWEAQQGEEGA